MWPWSSSAYQAIIDTKLATRAEALSNAPPSLTSEHGPYLKATASEIVARIEKGEWTASEVLEAYIARAAQAQAVTNCLTEILFDQARRRAVELDNEFASTKRLRGPLHGVPVSFKDQFDIIGFDSSVGFTQWANNPSTTNADLVNHILAAGAIPIVKTNVPQTMLAFECCNPLWGRTTHPYNDKYTSGGSSGGEAALLAMDGSVVGLGSDIGGSLRIPAAYCGIYSLKPGHNRIGNLGARGPNPGFEGIKAVVGPMSRSVADLELVCRLTFGLQGPYLDNTPLPYRDTTLPKKLRFGYYTSDGYVKASPACKRAVLETVDALRREGHECIEFEVPDMPRGFNVFVALSSSDGYKTMLSHLGPDPKDPSLFLSTLGPRLNWMLRAFAAWGIETFLHDKLFADTLRLARTKTIAEHYEFTVQRDQYIRYFYREVWAKYELDGIIAPVQALPQLPHGGCTTLSALAMATILYNVVDSPVGCIPVTHVDPQQDKLTDEWVNGPGLGSRIIEDQLYRGKNPVYDPVAMKGLPVGVQIVGKKWDEEKVIAMMHVIDQALGKKRGFGPGSWDEDKVIKD